MSAWLIVLIALWIYPILGFVFHIRSKDKSNLRNKVYLVIFILCAITILAYKLGVSFVSATADWIAISTPYLFACVIVWWTQNQKTRTIRAVGVAVISVFYILNYFTASIGILGVGFALAEMEPEEEVHYENGLTSKVYTLGNATTDYRGQRIRITRKIPAIPVLEKVVFDTSYYNIGVDRIRMTYETGENIFYLKSYDNQTKEPRNWRDTIRIID